MVYAIRKNSLSYEATIFYNKKDIPKNEIFILELDNIEEPPNAYSILKFNEDFTKVFWDDQEKELLNNKKEQRIKESKILLEKFLIENPLYSNVHKQTYDYYTVTEEKQTLLTSEFMGYQVMKTAGIDTTISWNATNKPCEIWEEEEIIALITEIRNYVKPLVTYQQKKELEINEAQSIQELEAIEIDYSIVHDNSTFEQEEASTPIINNEIKLVDDLQ